MAIHKCDENDKIFKVHYSNHFRFYRISNDQECQRTNKRAGRLVFTDDLGINFLPYDLLFGKII